MARKYLDCREHPNAESSKQCTVAISADSDAEVIETAVGHAVQVHGYKDTPELRKQLKSGIKQGSPHP
jgi:predicted small metal-binding protein